MKDQTAEQNRTVQTAVPTSILYSIESDTRFRMKQTEATPYRAACFEDNYGLTEPISKSSEDAARRSFLLVVLLLVTCVFTYLAVTRQIAL